MMYRVLIAATACVAVSGFAAPSASGASLSAATYRCEADATWNVYTPLLGEHWAELTYDTGASGCERIRATAADDGTPPAVTMDDFRWGASHAFDLLGVRVTGGRFAGRVSRRGGTENGEMTILEGELNAVIAGVAPNGEQTVVHHAANGTCGDGCYRTRMVWEGSFVGAAG